MLLLLISGAILSLGIAAWHHLALHDMVGRSLPHTYDRHAVDHEIPAMIETQAVSNAGRRHYFLSQVWAAIAAALIAVLCLTEDRIDGVIIFGGFALILIVTMVRHRQQRMR